ncbi:hypothetical protein BKA64DRAFT_700917 [Cadophora sp. MPI-SDFR-AT-0126]|nr:hypothetical protein BKA64DRAFT_700917 [Leotiomycetes sp. MPI-SDFR-AT-0126]
MNGYTVTPHHRQNRRRERPGTRTRRTITRKANVQYDVYEGVLDAHDAEVHLPSDKARPSPLLRQNFDQNWQRWKARQAEEKALAEMDRMQSEHEQLQFEIGDDELYRLGILYNDNEDLAQDSESNIIACDVPTEPSVPMFIFRQGKPRRSRRRPNWRSLPLCLSLSSLSDDADIARLLSLSPFPTIQHRLTTLAPTPMDIPQSLPPPAMESPYHDDNDNTISISSPPPPQQYILDFNSGDWTFIHTPHHTDPSPTPSSEPETWILIDDS